MRFVHTRVRAFHAAVTGHIGSQWQYRLMASRRAGWGTTLMPMTKATYTSLLAEAAFTHASLNGLQIKAMLATDHGTLGLSEVSGQGASRSKKTNVGGLLSITYSGNFTIGKK